MVTWLDAGDVLQPLALQAPTVMLYWPSATEGMVKVPVLLLQLMVPAAVGPLVVVPVSVYW